MINAFQFDVYGQITNTNYKYIVVKNETKTNNVGQKPGDDQVRGVSYLNFTLYSSLKH